MWECPKCETLNEEGFCIVCDEPEPSDYEKQLIQNKKYNSYYIPPVTPNTNKIENDNSKDGSRIGKILLILILVIVIMIIGIVAISEMASASATELAGNVKCIASKFLEIRT